MKHSSTSAERPYEPTLKRFRLTFIHEIKPTKVHWSLEGPSMDEALLTFIILTEETYPAGIRPAVCVEEIKAESIPEQPSDAEWREGA